MPKTKANRDVRSSPNTRLTIKAPVRIRVALPTFIFCIIPVSCAASAAGAAGLL